MIKWAQLAVLSLAELGALSLWFSASAVLPALTREWALGDGGRAGLTLAVQLGFIVGTLVSAVGNLPDVWSPRRLMAASAAAGALANAALALWVDSLAPALLLRFLTGAAMAGAYPPAMKIMATWFREGRGLAIGVIVGALTVGSATPHLIRGVTAVHWRVTLLVASVLALLAAGLVIALVREGPHRFPSARFDARMALAVFRERGARLACFGYFGHMWELSFTAVLGARVQQLTLEFARRGHDDVRLFKEFMPSFGPGLGVIDVKSHDVESPAVVAERIRPALEIVPAERLSVNPDCGCLHLPREARLLDVASRLARLPDIAAGSITSCAGGAMGHDPLRVGTATRAPTTPVPIDPAPAAPTVFDLDSVQPVRLIAEMRSSGKPFHLAVAVSPFKYVERVVAPAVQLVFVWWVIAAIGARPATATDRAPARSV